MYEIKNKFSKDMYVIFHNREEGKVKRNKIMQKENRKFLHIILNVIFCDCAFC